MSIYRSSKLLLSTLRSNLLDDKLITAQVRLVWPSLVQLLAMMIPAPRTPTHKRSLTPFFLT